MTNHNSTIKILGAGLSGLSAAILLAKAEYSVNVYEKNSHIGGRFQKNICALRNYGKRKVLEEISNFGIDIKPAYTINRVIKISPHTRHTIDKKEVLYDVIIRGGDEKSIENQLYRMAVDAGVRVIFDNKDVVYPEIDIIAVGSIWIGRNIYGVGYRYSNPEIDENTMYMFYDTKISPLGYLCVIPENNEVVVLSVSFDPHKFAQLRFTLDRFLQENPLFKHILSGAEMCEVIDGYGYYAKNPLNTPIHDGKLLVGEAAGFLDASRGFGIRYAIITGALAARSIINDTDYVSLLKKYFGDEFEKNLKKREKIDTFSNDDYDSILSHLGRKMSISEYIKVD